MTINNIETEVINAYNVLAYSVNSSDGTVECYISDPVQENEIVYVNSEKVNNATGKVRSSHDGLHPAVQN